MGTAMVRISERTRETLRKLARAEDESMQAVLEKAVEAYRRKLLFAELDAAYAKLRKDSGAWEAVETERRLWDATLADGIPEGEGWGDDGAPKADSQG